MDSETNLMKVKVSFTIRINYDAIEDGKIREEILDNC